MNGVRTGEAWNALKAFEAANGLPATGVLTQKTGEKPAPFLPQPQ